MKIIFTGSATKQSTCWRKRSYLEMENWMSLGKLTKKEKNKMPCGIFLIFHFSHLLHFISAKINSTSKLCIAKPNRPREVCVF